MSVAVYGELQPYILRSTDLQARTAQYSVFLTFGCGIPPFKRFPVTSLVLVLSVCVNSCRHLNLALLPFYDSAGS